ncbi:MAG TPA: tetratricopeptide repeat protein [Ktedonobacterales bacterium]|jgi:predicted ATPase/DNA-binding XRE family transcriptional regulator
MMVFGGHHGGAADEKAPRQENNAVNADEPSFGASLKQYRLAAGLTQEALAERAGLSARAISDLERGVNRIPRQDTLDLLAQALRLPPRKRALLVAAARPIVDPAAALEPQIHPPHNLPLPLTPLIGRESDALRAAMLLGRKEVRLLTLVGPSGVGKTRLGLQVAEDLLDRFDDGVWFVGLAVIRDPALVAAAIAQALGLREAAGQAPRDLLKTALRERQSLLLLDNFEQVADAAPLVAELLSACPRLTILVTSRAALHIRGEYELPVAPLEQEAAITLFLQRAQAVQPDLDVTLETIQAAGAICQRLDRLPLALELAAARVKALPPQTLLERLNSRLPLLTGGAFDLPERQRTMRDAVAWSYELLSPGEQRLFRRLAAFAGGCALEAAEAICGEADEASTAVLEALTALVDKSLLRAENAEAKAPRFSMLEIIREYALERLRESGEAETLGRRHAEYYARLAEELGHVGPDQDRRDAQLMREYTNVRAALEWTREQRETGLGLRLANACGRTWYSRGMLSEVLGWHEALLALDDAAGARAATPPVRIGALFGLAQDLLDLGQYDRVEMLAKEGLALAESIGDESGMGNALNQLGVVAETRGDLPLAARLLEQGLERCRQAGDLGGEGRILITLGHVFRARGNYPRATQVFEEALAQTRRIGLTWGTANILTSLALLARDQSDYPRALALYRESLSLHRTFGNKTYIAWIFEGMAAAASALGEPERAARLCAAAARLREEMRSPRPPAEQLPYDQTVAAAQQTLGSERFEQVWTAGQALSLEEALSYALADDAGR